MNSVRSQQNQWQVIWMLAKTDLKMRYSGSILGILWVFLKPLFIFLVLNFVFSHVFANGDPHFSLKLLTGLILWSFFAEGTLQGLMSLVTKAHILKKIYIPKWSVIVASTVHSLMAFVFNLCILAIFFAAYGVVPGWQALVWFALLVVSIYIIVLSFSFLTAGLFVRFRDLGQIWEVLLQLLFYAAPIIYPITILPEEVRRYVFLNPMTFAIEHGKMILIEGQFIRMDQHWLYFALVGVVFVFSLGVLSLSTKKVIEQL